MLCLEVLLNGHRMARAGGFGVLGLLGELSGGREGPIGLTVHGLSKEQDRHLWWVGETIKSSAVVTFNVLNDSSADSEPPTAKRITPIIAKRNELTMAVAVNGQHLCQAQLADFEGLGAFIEWCEIAECFLLSVRSMTFKEEGYGATRDWCEVNLSVGDSATLRIWSDQQE